MVYVAGNKLFEPLIKYLQKLIIMHIFVEFNFASAGMQCITPTINYMYHKKLLLVEFICPFLLWTINHNHATLVIATMYCADSF